MSLILYELAGADPDLRFSPYCWKIRMALHHKHLPFTTRPWRFIEKNITSQVPMLLDGGQTLTDSWRIARYLEQQYPDAPSLFGSSQKQALSEIINFWGDRTLGNPLQRIIILDIYHSLDQENQRYYRESREKRLQQTLEETASDPQQAIDTFRHLLDPLRLLLQQHPFLLGDTPCYADYSIFGFFIWARCVAQQPDRLLAADDPVAAWQERMLDLFDGEARHALRAADLS